MIASIDVGKNGAIAIMDNKRIEFYYKMPVLDIIKNKKKSWDYDLRVLWNIFTTHRDIIDRAFIELLHAYPGQSSKSNFMTGGGFYTFRNIFVSMNIRHEIIVPVRWKKYHGLIGKGKGDSIIKAQQLFPDQIDWEKYRKHDGIAEALLLGLYGIEK